MTEPKFSDLGLSEATLDAIMGEKPAPPYDLPFERARPVVVLHGWVAGSGEEFVSGWELLCV